MQRVLFGDLPSLVQAIGSEHISAAGAIGERSRLLEHAAGAKVVEEGVVRIPKRRIERRLADGEDQIFDLSAPLGLSGRPIPSRSS